MFSRRVFRRLVRDGLVGRRRSDVDRRSWLVDLTARGREAVAVACPLVASARDDTLGSLSGREVGTFDRLLRKLLEGQG